MRGLADVHAHGREGTVSQYTRSAASTVKQKVGRRRWDLPIAFCVAVVYPKARSPVERGQTDSLEQQLSHGEITTSRSQKEEG